MRGSFDPCYIFNHMRFVLVFFSLFSIISCSIVNLLLDFKGKKSTTVYEGIAEYCLNFKNTSRALASKSMFSKLPLSSSDYCGKIKNEDYKFLMNGLDGYLQKYALTTMIMKRSGTFGFDDRKRFFSSIDNAIEEEEYLGTYDLDDFGYSSKTLELIFNAFAEIDPTNADTFEFIIEFAKHCTTDTELTKPLAMIVETLKTGCKKIPFITFSPKLVSSEQFDNFITELHSNHCHDLSAAIALAKNIIHGPITEISTNILFSLELGQIVPVLCLEERDINQMIRRILGSNSIDRFLGIIEINNSNTNTNTNTNIEAINNIKIQLENQIQNREAIEIFKKFGSSVGDERLSGFVGLFDSKWQALSEFYKIDKMFVEASILVIDDQISSLIQLINTITDRRKINIAIVLVLKYLKILPPIKMKQKLGNNFEKALDLLVHPLAYSKNLIMKYSKSIKQTMILSYINVDCSTLEKLYLMSMSSGSEYESVQLLKSFSYFLFCRRDFDNKFELFQEIHKFHELKELCMDYIAANAILKTFSLHDHALAKQLLDYSIEHQFISKSYILSIGKFLEKFRKPK